MVMLEDERGRKKPYPLDGKLYIVVDLQIDGKGLKTKCRSLDADD